MVSFLVERSASAAAAGRDSARTLANNAIVTAESIKNPCRKDILPCRHVLTQSRILLFIIALLLQKVNERHQEY